MNYPNRRQNNNGNVLTLAIGRRRSVLNDNLGQLLDARGDDGSFLFHERTPLIGLRAEIQLEFIKVDGRGVSADENEDDINKEGSGDQSNNGSIDRRKKGCYCFLSGIVASVRDHDGVNTSHVHNGTARGQNLHPPVDPTPALRKVEGCGTNSNQKKEKRLLQAQTKARRDNNNNNNAAAPPFAPRLGTSITVFAVVGRHNPYCTGQDMARAGFQMHHGVYRVDLRLTDCCQEGEDPDSCEWKVIRVLDMTDSDPRRRFPLVFCNWLRQQTWWLERNATSESLVLPPSSDRPAKERATVSTGSPSRHNTRVSASSRGRPQQQHGKNKKKKSISKEKTSGSKDRKKILESLQIPVL